MFNAQYLLIYYSFLLCTFLTCIMRLGVRVRVADVAANPSTDASTDFFTLMVWILSYFYVFILSCNVLE